MSLTRVAQILKAGQPGTTVDVRGWVRTKRESKQDFAFLEINDGSCMKNVQIVVDAKIPDYASLIKQISTGASVAVVGEIKESLGKGQRVEVHAQSLKVLGTADPLTYPLQKKRAQLRIPSREGTSQTSNKHVWCHCTNPKRSLLSDP